MAKCQLDWSGAQGAQLREMVPHHQPFAQGSVNDGISSDFCSMEYTSVDRVTAAAMTLGRGMLPAKIDIKSAYRIIPVRVGDRPLLGITWRGRFYVDARLPFLLRSATKNIQCSGRCLE